ncbi:uncharacterized protein B0I36DRAFT_321591 [Microdochium trichocladiopsis]|uniref:LPXTG-domain-containing protein n=1 Tax=Microdochium trichocladiopsis TaxID=1682393 RepID=A0A9P9BPV2_9PEZI|nr:uncharacterized protein B0I36DRAFT_321591 [Microdochium trichocladiopsis]KAH7033504.1 hypothetical protein B0I36DRAFT_321591 [Microdochium trichocladiopsis]
MARACASMILAICLLTFSHYTSALQVTPGSACAAVCLDNPEDNPNDPIKSTTTPKDVVCTDSKYTTQAAGIKYKNCLQCLQSSHVSKGTESDADWYLYNLRYTVNVCLYGYPNVTMEQLVSSPCNTEYACQPFEDALQVGILNPDKTGALDYCTADGGSFTGPRFSSCVKCLQSSADQTYLANFMIALMGGCDYRPNSETLLGLSSSVFQSAEVEVIDPSANTTLSEGNTTQGMSVGAIAGIAIGAGLLFLGGTALFWVYYRKQKRMYNLDPREISHPRMYDHGMPPHFMGGGMRSLHSKNNSLASSFDAQMKPAPVFNYTQKLYQQDARSITSAGIGHTNYNFDPHQRAQGPNAALPTHPAYIPHTMSRAGLTRSPSPPQPNHQRSQMEHEGAPEGPQFQERQKPPKPRTLSSLSIFPQMSTAAHARVEAYVLDDSNSHPLPVHEGLPQLPRAVVTAGTGSRGPSPAFSNHQHATPPRGPSPNDDPTARLLPNGGFPPPPPPPPAASRAIKLSMPTVPKLRTAKQYTPPQIVTTSRDESGSGTGSLSPDCGPGESNVTIGLDIGNPLPQHRPRWANESTAGVSLPGQNGHFQQQQHQGYAGGAEFQYDNGGWRGQGVARNFSNPYSKARLPDRSRRETQFEDLETPASGMSERIYG